MIQARNSAFADHNIVERVIASYANVFAIHLAMHHGTRVQVAATLLNAVQRGVQIFQGDFGEESERPQVNAEDRDSSPRDCPGRRKQRTVSSQNHYKV